MKSALVLAVVLVALSSFPLRSQQPASIPQQNQPNSAQQPGQADATANAPAATPEPQAATHADLRPVSGELESALDSTTSKAGDSVVVKTETTVKTANGTVIPRGSKLVGHVVGVQAEDNAHRNSQVAIQFDHAEVKGGQTVPLQTVIRSVGTRQDEMTNRAGTTGPGMNAPSAPVPNTPSSGTASGAAATDSAGNSHESMSPSAGAPEQSSPNAGPAPGTLVARSGDIAIRTTSIPGVLVANDEQGQDPRLLHSSGILLGAKKNIQLGSGTTMELAVADVSAH
ncbi:MAG TPA: hypothetical protein VMU48_11795 [Terracidiphilus sp.]|nr:hypothetical protein [Terracidiphilus sp.]